MVQQERLIRLVLVVVGGVGHREGAVQLILVEAVVGVLRPVPAVQVL